MAQGNEIAKIWMPEDVPSDHVLRDKCLNMVGGELFWCLRRHCSWEEMGKLVRDAS